MVIEIMFNLINLIVDSYNNILCISVDIATVFDQRCFSSILFFDTNTGQCGDHEHSHRVCVAGNMIGEAGAASLAPALREMNQLQHLNLEGKQHTGGGSCGAECAG